MNNAIEGKEPTMVRCILPSLGAGVKLDRRCPDCHCEHGRIHSWLRRRRIRDMKVLAHPYLSSFLRGHDGVCDLRKVI